jgi:hypothetical protein
MLPTPLQRPRIPIWVAGFWPNKPPFRPAARWDGAIPLRRGFLLEGLPPPELRDCVNYMREGATGRPVRRAALRHVAAAVPRTGRRMRGRRGDLVDRGGQPLEESLVEFRDRMIRGPSASPTTARR